MQKVSHKKILFVEDNIDLLNNLLEYFRARENTVFGAKTKREAAVLLHKENFDICILDLILPDGMGLDLFEYRDVLPPVIIMSDLGTEDDMLEGFDSGAVDYVVKPCSMRLLETRMGLRLSSGDESKITSGELKIDTTKRVATYRGEVIPLTGSEFNILHFLMTHAGEFYSANEIYEAIWKAPSLNSPTIRKHISSMRRKITDIAPDQEFILTDFGKGYAFTKES